MMPITASQPRIRVQQLFFQAESHGSLADISTNSNGLCSLRAWPRRKSRRWRSSIAKLVKTRCLVAMFVAVRFGVEREHTRNDVMLEGGRPCDPQVVVDIGDAGCLPSVRRPAHANANLFASRLGSDSRECSDGRSSVPKPPGGGIPCAAPGVSPVAPCQTGTQFTNSPS